MTTEERPTEPAPRVPPPTRQVLAAERRVKALDLRKAGHTYREIGAELKIDHKTALRDVQASLKAMVAEPAEEVRKLELSRLDSLWKIAFEIAEGKDSTREQRIKAIDSCLRIATRRATMEGIDAPQRVEVGSWLEDLARSQGLDPGTAFETAKEIVKTMGF